MTASSRGSIKSQLVHNGFWVIQGLTPMRRVHGGEGVRDAFKNYYFALFCYIREFRESQNDRTRREL